MGGDGEVEGEEDGEDDGMAGTADELLVMTVAMVVGRGVLRGHSRARGLERHFAEFEDVK